MQPTIQPQSVTALSPLEVSTMPHLLAIIINLIDQLNVDNLLLMFSVLRIFFVHGKEVKFVPRSSPSARSFAQCILPNVISCAGPKIHYKVIGNLLLLLRANTGKCGDDVCLLFQFGYVATLSERV